MHFSWKTIKCPTKTEWLELLDSQCDEGRMLEHIENCDRCKREIDELAAERSLWHEAGETLSIDMPNLSRLTESICPLSMAGPGIQKYHEASVFHLLPIQQTTHSMLSPEHRTQSAQFLGDHELQELQRLLPAPCHPELLARIGRYELEQLIGRGGMGLVFRARDTELHRVVAIKTLALYLLPFGSARERFIREGRAAAMLSHSHIVPMYDVITESRVPALVMQYVPGPTLQNWVAERGPMNWQFALNIGAQLSDALSAAHFQGLVHRDLKPSNVLLEVDGTRALLTDFGLVRAMDDATLTHSGMLAGTPYFMSPEQARGDDVDGRSDLFSLGCLLYFVMTGHPPFRGRESMAVLNAVCHHAHKPLVKVNREIPLEVSRLVDRLLSKQTKHRPASSAEVCSELRSLLGASRRLRRDSSKMFSPLLRIAVASFLCAILLMGFSMWIPVQTRYTPSGSYTYFPAHDQASETISVATDQPLLVESRRIASEYADFERLAQQTLELELMMNGLYESIVPHLRSTPRSTDPLAEEFSKAEGMLHMLDLHQSTQIRNENFNSN